VPGLRHLVQYRSFVPSVVSNFELHVRGGGEDSPQAFRVFARSEFGRYRAFMRKWVESDFARSQFILRYEDFMADPAGQLARALACFDPATPVDAARVTEAVRNIAAERVTAEQIVRQDKAGVRERRKVEEFRYYDKDLFQQLSRLQLSRQEVVSIFGTVLGREPVEEEIIPHQTMPSTDALAEVLPGWERRRIRRLQRKLWLRDRRKKLQNTLEKFVRS